MRGLPDNSIDAVVTDPPYELGFMGKKWDSTGIAYNVELWQEVLRVLKPGGYLLAFGGTRTYHRMACAIEDAGFETHPMIAWIYGSGFPKATNLGKQFDKQAGAEREKTRYRIDGRGKWELKMNREKGDTGIGHADGSKQKYYETAPATPEAQQWDGWYYGKQSLKPAIEPICMAQKPIDGKRMTDNVLKWGTGGINVDGCRIPLQEYGEDKRLGGSGNWKTDKMAKNTYEGGYEGKCVTSSELGRFPANVILDEEAGRLLDDKRPIVTGKQIGRAHV